MKIRWLKAALCAAALSCAIVGKAHAGNVTLVAPDQKTPLGASADSPLFVTGGGGGGGATGSVTSAGTNGGAAQAVQGINGGVPLAVTWSGQTVAATQSGAWSVSISNFPTTQAVNNAQVNGVAIATGTGASNTGTQRVVTSSDSTVTANLGTLNGAALDTSVQQVKTTLGSPFQAGGSIANTAFGISGTLPAYAAIPTFKVDQTTPGTTNKVSIGTDGTVTANQGGAPWSTTISGTLPAFAAIPAFKIDQTTPGTTNKVSIGTDGQVTNSPSTGATIATSQPTITTTAAALTFSGTVHREIQNTGTANIFIGPSGVTTSTGFPIPPGSTYDASRFSGTLYAVAAASQTAALISY